MNEETTVLNASNAEGSDISNDESTVDLNTNNISEDNTTEVEEEDSVLEEEDDYEEEYIRLATKEGVEYLLNSPLPPAKGFVFGEDGTPLVWNPLKLRMERYSPEEVTIKKISLFHLSGADDVFRIFCLANKGGEYKDAGLTVIRTVPISEISSWDTIVDEKVLITSENIETE